MCINFRDCYYNFFENILTLGNRYIERRIEFRNKYPVTTFIENKITGYKWKGKSEPQQVMFNSPAVDFKNCSINVEHYISDNYGLSEQHLVVEVIFESGMNTVRLQFSIFSELPFVTGRLFVKGREDGQKVISKTEDSREHNGIENNYFAYDNLNMDTLKLPEIDCIDSFNLNNRHLKLETLELIDRTDVNDHLLKEQEQRLYGSQESRHSGSVFILDSYLEDEGIILVKEGPSISSCLNRTGEELRIKPDVYLQFIGSGIDYSKIKSDEFTLAYGCTIGVGRVGELKALYKRLYNKICLGDKSEELFIMSNTWGDRNQDAAICHDFIKKELETAAKLGVDILQIDDGWEKGITANSKLVKGGVWEGYYSSDSDFWDINKKKFPQGFKPIAHHAESLGIKIGLWFSPDSSKDFANWRRDVETLLDLYRKYKVKYFKLDGVKIRSKQSEINFTSFLQEVTEESNGQISFNLDVTAEVRYGYLYEKQFGTIFVENRYTDWGNYYPHNTFKNLWQLSKVIPPRRLQFEVLNNKRNIEKYKGDRLAPNNYSIDYIFATVMVANPLVWMEMSSLQEKDAKLLKGIISVYKSERRNIFNSDVIPIGNMPDGLSFTGFQANVNDSTGYLLLFREATNCDCYKFKLAGLKDSNIEMQFLYGNFNVDNYMIGNHISEACELSVRFLKERSFAFIKFRKI